MDTSLDKTVRDLGHYYLKLAEPWIPTSLSTNKNRHIAINTRGYKLTL